MMKGIYIILCLLILEACSSNDLTSDPECEQVPYSQNSSSFTIVGQVVFDTSANLFHARVLDFTTSEPLPGAQLHFDQSQLTKEINTDQSGETEIFENGFYGTWQLLVTHPDYRCVMVNDVEIAGGQYVVIKLKHK
jgi:hypothetical protein